MLADLRLVVDLSSVARMGGTIQLHAGADKLRRILVRRRHVDVEPRRCALHRQSAHYVIRLEAVNAHDGNLQRLGELERIGNRGREVFRHLLPLRLVGRVGLVTKRRPARVHCEDRVRRLLLLENRLQPVRQPEERRRVDTARRHPRIAQEHEVSLVEERHQVDDEKLVHPRTPISRRYQFTSSGP